MWRATACCNYVSVYGYSMAYWMSAGAMPLFPAANILSDAYPFDRGMSITRARIDASSCSEESPLALFVDMKETRTLKCLFGIHERLCGNRQAVCVLC